MKNQQNTHVANNINKNPIQVKMFGSPNIDTIETALNAFLTEGNMFVMDIKYQVDGYGENNMDTFLSAMVIYKNL